VLAVVAVAVALIANANSFERAAHSAARFCFSIRLTRSLARPPRACTLPA
jgi:hypothetical protein